MSLAGNKTGVLYPIYETEEGMDWGSSKRNGPACREAATGKEGFLCRTYMKKNRLYFLRVEPVFFV
jgi:hypothetical protein